MIETTTKQIQSYEIPKKTEAKTFRGLINGYIKKASSIDDSATINKK